MFWFNMFWLFSGVFIISLICIIVEQKHKVKNRCKSLIGRDYKHSFK